MIYSSSDQNDTNGDDFQEQKCLQKVNTFMCSPLVLRTNSRRSRIGLKMCANTASFTAPVLPIGDMSEWLSW